MKSIGTEFLRPDALSGVNHMSQIVLLNFTFGKSTDKKCMCTILHLHTKLPFCRLGNGSDAILGPHYKTSVSIQYIPSLYQLSLRTDIF